MRRHANAIGTALSDARLAELRGGVSLPSGLILSFGIERAVFVNDQLVATTQLRISNPAHITTATALDAAGFDRTTLVQIGDGNAYYAGALAGLVVQNSADQQAIRTSTMLDVRVGGLGMFRLANVEASLQNVLASAALSP